MGAVATGRLGTAVMLVLLPPVGVLAGRILGASRRRARRSAWAMALLVAVVTAFVPLFWLITTAPWPLACSRSAVAVQRAR